MASKLFVCFALLALCAVVSAEDPTVKTEGSEQRVKKAVIIPPAADATYPYGYGYSTPYSYASFNSYPASYNGYYPYSRSAYNYNGYNGYYPYNGYYNGYYNGVRSYYPYAY
ncbi:staphylococcal secretory antigen ssaA2-like [Adelges cooleyi]|uniref:staphylococcal secretory antigen ssaA2-like n=1 Tax=Adelges cooleyi TaxID=133065 RepID=UPI00218035ED|nr:staphylococcal secretory antigen ssaA2-like [Adelges cooleyi]